MDAQNFFYISAGIVAWLGIILLLILTVKLLQLLRSVENLKQNAREYQQAAQLGFWSLISTLLGKFTKGGEKHG